MASRLVVPNGWYDFVRMLWEIALCIGLMTVIVMGVYTIVWWVT